MTSSPERARSEIVRVDEEEHLSLLADFVRQVWTPDLAIESLRASRNQAAKLNPIAPGQAPPTFLFLLDGRAVGHLTTIPTRLQLGEWVGPAHWLKGFWVLPEHRNGPIGAMLVREAARELDCLMATVVDDAPRRVFEAFKMQDLGVFTEHVKLLRPADSVRRLDLNGSRFGSSPVLRTAFRAARLPGVPWLGGALVRAAYSIRSTGAGGARDVCPAHGGQDSDGFDALWEEVASDRLCSPVRDAAYLERVYDRGLNGSYAVLSLARAGRPIAWASIRRPRKGPGDPRLGGLRVATLSDIVVSPAHTEDAFALLREAEQLAREMGADALLCSATHPSLRGWLSRRAFVSLPGSLHLAVRGPREGPGLPDSLDDWWLTRADGGADDGL